MTESNVHPLPVAPNGEMMRSFISRLFEHAGMTGLVEVSWTSTRSPHKLSGAKLFDLADLDLAAEEAATLNASPSRNVYVSAGLRNPDTPTQERAKDSDVFACVAFWCDFDEPRALERGLEEAININLPPQMIVHTGHEPHTRGQLWWILDEPCTDLALHNRLIRALTVQLNGDRAVTNPSRVMRVAGSVAWPLKAGRVLEMTSLADVKPVKPYELSYFEWRLDQCGATQQDMLAPQIPTPTISAGSGYNFNSATAQVDLEALIAQARKPHEWHNAALTATAHLIARGTPPEVALDMLTPMLQQPGYTHQRTRQELKVMIDGAFKKYAPPQLQPVIEPVATETNPFLSIDQLLAMPPPEWILDGYLQKQGMSALFAPPGAFKSFVALDIALSVAYGLDWHGHAVKQRKVLYICAEGQYGFGTRALAWRHHRANDQSTDQFHVLPVAINLLDPGNVASLIDAITLYLDGVGLIIIDTLARSFGAGDENSTKDMNAYVHGAGKLVECGCHVMHVHHSGKDESKGERGSSVFRAALDTLIQLDREPGSDVVTVVMRKQKDAPELKPMNLAVVVAEAVHPLTGEIVSSRVPTFSEVVENAPAGTADDPLAGLSKVQRKLLQMVVNGEGSVSVLARAAGVDSSNCRRALRRLSDRKLIEANEDGFWREIISKQILAGQTDWQRTLDGLKVAEGDKNAVDN